MSWKGAKRRKCQWCDATFYTAVGVSICRGCRDCPSCVKLKGNKKALSARVQTLEKAIQDLRMGMMHIDCRGTGGTYVIDHKDVNAFFKAVGVSDD